MKKVYIPMIVFAMLITGCTKPNNGATGVADTVTVEETVNATEAVTTEEVTVEEVVNTTEETTDVTEEAVIATEAEETVYVPIATGMLDGEEYDNTMNELYPVQFPKWDFDPGVIGTDVDFKRTDYTEHDLLENHTIKEYTPQEGRTLKGLDWSGIRMGQDGGYPVDWFDVEEFGDYASEAVTLSVDGYNITSVVDDRVVVPEGYTGKRVYMDIMYTICTDYNFYDWTNYLRGIDRCDYAYGCEFKVTSKTTDETIYNVTFVASDFDKSAPTYGYENVYKVSMKYVDDEMTIIQGVQPDIELLEDNFREALMYL